MMTLQLKLLSICFVVGIRLFAIVNSEGLSLAYYKKSCPRAENIVKSITEQHVTHVPSFAPGLLRMIFHDCAVRCRKSKWNYSTGTEGVTRCLNNPSDLTSFVFMDRISPRVFDEKYYTMVTQNRGLFQSDAALLNDIETKRYIDLQVNTRGSNFANDFAESMGKMIKIGVLTSEDQGEIRRNCGSINS